jgi:ribosomal protein S27E
MSDFVTLTCPSCGGRLQITADTDRFACSHCGNDHVVKRSGGIVTLAPVVERLSRIQRGTDNTAAELGIRRLRDEIPTSEEEVTRFALEAMEKDYPQIRSAFAAMGKKSQLGSVFTFDKRRDRERVESMVLGLSSAEAEQLVAAMNRDSSAYPPLKTMVAAKRDLEKKRLHLEKLRDLVAE